MDKKAITLQQLEEALRDLTRWIREKLTGYLQEPADEGQSGYVLTTNGAGGRSWEAVGGLEIDSTLSVEGAAADAAAAGAAIAAAQAAADKAQTAADNAQTAATAAGEAADKAQAAADAPVTTEKLADGAVTGDKLAAEVHGRFSAYNLLDNSDFANPVAQAGLNGAHGSVAYAIDRWMAHNLTVEQQADCLKATPTKTYAYIRQKVKVTPGKTYTCAAHFSSVGVGAISVYNADMSTHYANKGNIAGRGMVTFTVPTDVDTISVLLYPNKANAASGLLYWAALYEGEYTAETLPEYQPKGYAAELAECMRYYRNLTDTDMMVTGLAVSSTVLRFIIPLVFPMRVAPTVIYNGMSWLRAGGTNASNPSTSLSSAYYRGMQIDLNIDYPTNSVPYNHACAAQFSNGFALSADL